MTNLAVSQKLKKYRGERLKTIVINRIQNNGRGLRVKPAMTEEGSP